ncbi:hypothetical protein [Gilvimarinus algae]|uniref:Outer membrane lipoprotein BamD-like domain-containing protein n=1 Tax=Gilvimarinus algae TaxID=3058037 RepID=A0ABT8TLT5_9GAMM|nr:hypothetical protein [Gilvimarinus sp. SDUM040014]MDO3384058.1 hypothetical protein [Gilvimarinus sp. SDUM040014]
MNFKSVGFLALFLAAPVFAGKVANDDLFDIYRLAEDGEYQEALAAHQDFFEQSRSSPDMGAVRLSYALSHWADLGRVYPPAQQALVELAETLKEDLLTGDAEFVTMMEYSSVNRVLDARTATAELFKQLSQRYPEQAKSYYFAVRDDLIAAGEYELIGKYLGDPILAFEDIRHSREQTLSSIRQGDYPLTPDDADNRYDSELNTLLNITRYLKMDEQTKEIERRDAAYRGSGRLSE